MIYNPSYLVKNNKSFHAEIWPEATHHAGKNSIILNKKNIKTPIHLHRIINLTRNNNCTEPLKGLLNPNNTYKISNNNLSIII